MTLDEPGLVSGTGFFGDKGIALLYSEFRALRGVRCPVPLRMCSEDSMVKRQADLRSGGV